MLVRAYIKLQIIQLVYKASHNFVNGDMFNRGRG